VQQRVRAGRADAPQGLGTQRPPRQDGRGRAPRARAAAQHLEVRQAHQVAQLAVADARAERGRDALAHRLCLRLARRLGAARPAARLSARVLRAASQALHCALS